MRFTRNVLILSTLMLTCTGVAQAEFVGLNIGSDAWGSAQTNSFTDTSGDLDNQPGVPGFDDQSTPSLLFVIEHPISIIPNFRYQDSALDSNGSDTLNGGFLSFNNQSFGDSTAGSTYDLAHNDIVLYYELMDNWINLDFGVDLKSFAGEISLSDSGPNNTVLPIDETIPLFYLSARYNLPFNGFYVGADINSNFSVSDSVAEDSTFLLGYKSENGLRVEGGIKMFSLELNESNDVDASLEYDGLFLNGYIPF
jgi:outer membrane protein